MLARLLVLNNDGLFAAAKVRTSKAHKQLFSKSFLKTFPLT